jgi:GWxTD domain-containing protein
MLEWSDLVTLTIQNPLRTLLLICLLSSPVGLLAQRFNLKESKTDFMSIVKPIITEGEERIYKSLGTEDDRQYFKAIFWYKRDDQPRTTKNAYRSLFFERRQIALEQFGEEGTEGTETDRGLIYLLLGDPDEVVQNRLAVASSRPAFEEVWSYTINGKNHQFRFVYDPTKSNSYILDEKEQHAPFLEEYRESLVLDRAEPYRSTKELLSLPNLGYTKDVENLAAEDKSEIDFVVSYAFFQGDQQKTKVLVGLTFRDASRRGVDINLACYDPYDTKVVDFKKREDVINGEFTHFSVVLEPDQYRMVLRLDDRDGRSAISRQTIDVPRISFHLPEVSSLLLSPGLERVPLEGFREPKQFVYGARFFPLGNDFKGFDRDVLYAMQIYYNFNDAPEVAFMAGDRKLSADVLLDVVEGQQRRRVYALEIGDLAAGSHAIHALIQSGAGFGQAASAVFNKADQQGEITTLLEAAEPAGDRMQWLLPNSDQAYELERVSVRFKEGLKPTAFFVYLNDRMLYARSEAPWAVSIDEGDISISGDHKLAVVSFIDNKLYKIEKTLIPLRADEKIKTRLVQIYFNAFNRDLQFQESLNFDDLEIRVDGELVQPKSIEKVDEPITYCFLVDQSFSMRESFKNNIVAVRRFIESMRPQDQGYFVGFSDTYSQILEPTPSKAVLLAAANSIQLQRPNPKYSDATYAENATYLYDATIAAIHTLLQYPGRKVIVLVTDGIGVEGIYRRTAMLSYARENEVVLYSLWLDNNPRLSEDEEAFLRKEKTKSERFLRAIGLSRFFAKKDAKANYIGGKVRRASINEGVMKILAEESGGFHYRIFKADRSLIKDYVQDIENAVDNQFALSLEMPLSQKTQTVDVISKDENIAIRNKSHVRVSQFNPLVEDID